jgi:hypothetical protein
MPSDAMENKKTINTLDLVLTKFSSIKEPPTDSLVAKAEFWEQAPSAVLTQEKYAAYIIFIIVNERLNQDQ